MTAWVESAEYQQAMNACRTNDRTALDRIIEERLLSVDGPERAFWLSIRAKERARRAVLPHMLEMVWADLEAASLVAPDDAVARAMAISSALSVAVACEQPVRALEALKALRHIFAWVPIPTFWPDVAVLNMKRERWSKAKRAWDRAIGEFQTLSPYEQKLHECRLPHFHAWRAICLASLGDVVEARRDAKAAHVLSESLPPRNINHLVLGMALAEVALAEGQTQEARGALQRGLMNDSLVKRPRSTPAHMAETEFLAARIALAESNPVGFAHFRERALGICRQHGLTLSEARIMRRKSEG